MSYNIVSIDNEETVVTDYKPEPRKNSEYQTEDQLEKDFIKRLQEQGYEYIDITDEKALKNNLRVQIEKLNDFVFSDKDWDNFFNNFISNKNDDIIEKTRKIQQNYQETIKLDDGTVKNISLIDKNNIHKNSLQVLNQYKTNDGSRGNRYDVTILVNGLPLVHIELKRRGVDIREAFNQIERYQRESFWSSTGLFQYVQIFVISNGTYTKYYSNTTRQQHLNEKDRRSKNSKNKTSNSFEFTSYWADSNNKIICDLVDFTKTFFAKHTILNIISRYCVFTSENLLLVMRPYQIVATERIMNRIGIAKNHNNYGKVEGGGYIWHTTGSGKTLTSFKTAQLAKDLGYIDKVLFVVDRKDLDYQTMKEYERFEKGSANSTVSMNILKKMLEDNEAKIIITTIQKLSSFVNKNKFHDIYNKHVVMIFDECHRSQFGKMHQSITKSFKNYYIFGFTGTPIFKENAEQMNSKLVCTTDQAFGEKLHTYTIVDAINDGNVLPFMIDYVNTINKSQYIEDKEVKAIDTEKALSDPRRISAIVKYVIDHFEQKTKRDKSSSYTHNGRVVNGFNSIFAADSIPMACKYYEEFKRQINDNQINFRIAMIYSVSSNEEYYDEDFDNDKLDKTSREFLESCISDYNATFGTNFDISNNSFQGYYKDVSQKLKNREIDLLIVVNMFLTGFDATTLNTLWVDKNLKYHGLIQAFSRTNRILNKVKNCGNIICFRDMKKNTDDALALFGNRDSSGVILLKTYEDYYNGYKQDGKIQPGYKELIYKLQEEYPIGINIVGEEAKKLFISLFGNILRIRNILTAFDQFEGNEILTELDFQDYRSMYIECYHGLNKTTTDSKENINDDIVFELELVNQVSVNLDYIIMIVDKYQKSKCKDKNDLNNIYKSINSSLKLRSKKELIEQFLNHINTDIHNELSLLDYVNNKKKEDLQIIINEEQLNEKKTIDFINRCFRNGELKTIGMDIDETLPPIPRFSGTVNRYEKKKLVIDKLNEFFEKYLGFNNES